MCEKKRCSWAGDIPIYIDYHDNEWGRPVHDDNKLFEMLILEGMQAGLNWITVLKKREAFREAFDGFDPDKVALYGEEKIQELLANEGIIRNRLKVNAAVTNARAFWKYRKNTEALINLYGHMWIILRLRTIGRRWRRYRPQLRYRIKSAKI